MLNTIKTLGRYNKKSERGRFNKTGLEIYNMLYFAVFCLFVCSSIGLTGEILAITLIMIIFQYSHLKILKIPVPRKDLNQL